MRPDWSSRFQTDSTDWLGDGSSRVIEGRDDDWAKDEKVNGM